MQKFKEFGGLVDRASDDSSTSLSSIPQLMVDPVTDEGVPVIIKNILIEKSQSENNFAKIMLNNVI